MPFGLTGGTRGRGIYSRTGDGHKEKELLRWAIIVIIVSYVPFILLKFGLPYFFDENRFQVFKKLLTRKLIIKGLFRHFSTLVKLTELFSVI